MSERVRITKGSGNVFADLGLPNPEERLAKAQLALQISQIFERRGLTQRAAAQLMGFLRALGRDIDIMIRSPARRHGRGRLRVVA